jgi:hypothetical protein
MTPECPTCASRETVMISDVQGKCLKCGEIFIVLNPQREEAA